MKIFNHRSFAATLAFASLSILNPQLSTVFAQGEIIPPGPPGPTFKTLSQIEPRTPISSAPFAITNPGSYYLVSNLVVIVGDAIVIATNNVTLDLNGFTISSTANPASGTAILLDNGRRHITIFNGHIKGEVIYNGAGNGDQFTGPGFLYGISWTVTDPRNARVSGVSVSGLDQHGIQLGDDYSTIVESCTVHTVGSEGIRAGVVSHSTAVQCGANAIVAVSGSYCYGTSTASYGFYGTMAANCQGISGTGTGLFAYSAQNCYGASTGAGTGHGIHATAALNCLGIATSSGDGIHAVSANNCWGQTSSGDGIYGETIANSYGYSTFGSGNGIVASQTAINCFGLSSQSGVGIDARLASNCWGESTSGDALEVLFAHNCVGFSFYGRGIRAFYSCVNSIGNTSSGTGIQAFMVNTSYGAAQSGTGLNANYGNFSFGSANAFGTNVAVGTKYNMP